MKLSLNSIFRRDRRDMGKKGNLGGMQGVLLALAFAAVTYLVTVIILGLGASLNASLAVGQTGTALSVFNNGTLGFANMAQNLPTIATVVVIVVIIALLFLGFGGLLSKDGGL